MQIDSFTTNGESGRRTYTLTAPSTTGTYTFNVTLKRAYTGETSTKSYTITVKITYSGYLSNLKATWDSSRSLMIYTWKVNINSGTGRWKVRFIGYFSDYTYNHDVSSVPSTTDWEYRENLSYYRYFAWRVILYAPDGTVIDDKTAYT